MVSWLHCFWTSGEAHIMVERYREVLLSSWCSGSREKERGEVGVGQGKL
jgi:hypothetical protein